MNTPDTGPDPTTSGRPGPVPPPPTSSGRHQRIRAPHRSGCSGTGCEQARAGTGEHQPGAYCDTCQDPDVLARCDGRVDYTVAWPCPLTRRPGYGPHQAAARVGLAVFQLDRAVAAGLLPAPTGGRWPGPVIDDAAARTDVIAAAVGTVADLGAARAAAWLAGRFPDLPDTGVEVTGDTVVELARAGLLPVTGQYHGHAVYDGRALEAFTDTTALARAARDGQLLTRAQAAARLGVRRCDLEHLLAAGLLKAARWGLSPWQSRRSRPVVPLLRAGDLDTLLADPRLDWPAVRATRPGRPSPLRHLTAGVQDRCASGREPGRPVRIRPSGPRGEGQQGAALLPATGAGAETSGRYPGHATSSLGRVHVQTPTSTGPGPLNGGEPTCPPGTCPPGGCPPGGCPPGGCPPGGCPLTGSYQDVILDALEHLAVTAKARRAEVEAVLRAMGEWHDHDPEDDCPPGCPHHRAPGCAPAGYHQATEHGARQENPR